MRRCLAALLAGRLATGSNATCARRSQKCAGSWQIGCCQPGLICYEVTDSFSQCREPYVPQCGVQNIDATATGSPGFQITLVNSNEPCDTTYDQYFVAAAAKWESVVRGDLPDQWTSPQGSSWFPGRFRMKPGNSYVDFGVYNGFVDDVIIAYVFVDIDGAGDIATGVNVLAASDKWWSRRSNDNSNYLTSSSGYMVFDSHDIAMLADDGQLQEVITHEMGHVLGLGASWAMCVECSAGNGSSGSYLCDNAQEMYAAAGFSEPSRLPVEADYGYGSACHHWDEAVLQNELMTPVVSPPGVFSPLSRITVGALEDLGYRVRYGPADAFQAAGAPESTMVNLTAQGVSSAYVTGSKRPFRMRWRDPCKRLGLCPPKPTTIGSSGL